MCSQQSRRSTYRTRKVENVRCGVGTIQAEYRRVGWADWVAYLAVPVDCVETSCGRTKACEISAGKTRLEVDVGQLAEENDEAGRRIDLILHELWVSDARQRVASRIHATIAAHGHEQVVSEVEATGEAALERRNWVEAQVHTERQTRQREWPKQIEHFDLVADETKIGEIGKSRRVVALDEHVAVDGRYLIVVEIKRGEPCWQGVFEVTCHEWRHDQVRGQVEDFERRETRERLEAACHAQY